MDPLTRRIHELEDRLGTTVVLRPLHAPDPEFRGRITHKAGRVLIEYRDDTPGFFWHHDTIGELLDLIECGIGDFTLYDHEPQASTDMEPD